MVILRVAASICAVAAIVITAGCAHSVTPTPSTSNAPVSTSAPVVTRKGHQTNPAVPPMDHVATGAEMPDGFGLTLSIPATLHAGSSAVATVLAVNRTGKALPQPYPRIRVSDSTGRQLFVSDVPVGGDFGATLKPGQSLSRDHRFTVPPVGIGYTIRAFTSDYDHPAIEPVITFNSVP